MIHFQLFLNTMRVLNLNITSLSQGPSSLNLDSGIRSSQSELRTPNLIKAKTAVQMNSIVI